MQNLLSSRGLAALAWLSAFAALWVTAFGLLPALTGGLLIFVSLIFAVLAMAVANPRERR